MTRGEFFYPITPQTETQTDSSVAIEFKNLREKQGLKQSQLAKYSGLGRSAISRIEGGNRQPFLDSFVSVNTGAGNQATEMLQVLENAGFSIRFLSDEEEYIAVDKPRFSEKIKEYRRRRQLSLRQVAIKAKFAHTTMLRMETEERRPKLKTAVGAINAIGMTRSQIEDLLSSADLQR